MYILVREKKQIPYVNIITFSTLIPINIKASDTFLLPL